MGLLDWYTVSVAVFAAVALAAHGATYLTLKTQGVVHDRSAGYARVLWAAAAPLLLVISAESEDELDAATKRAERAAGQVGCEVRTLFGRQGQAFLAAALPLGRYTL